MTDTYPGRHRQGRGLSTRAIELLTMMSVLVLTSPLLSQKGQFEQRRLQMVKEAIMDAGVKNPRVIKSMQTTKRHEFVASRFQKQAYFDMALPIGDRQTISSPFIVAYMTEALQLPPNARVLEIGTGSGYQAAVLAEIATEVYSIEIVPELATKSHELLNDLGYDNVHVRMGDGYGGWPEEAPFDGVIVTAAPDHIPPALVEQLAEGARLVIPVGETSQAITIVTKQSAGSTSEITLPVRFVPMTGEAER